MNGEEEFIALLLYDELTWFKMWNTTDGYKYVRRRSSHAEPFVVEKTFVLTYCPNLPKALLLEAGTAFRIKSFYDGITIE